jgi:hypothetical protein
MPLSRTAASPKTPGFVDYLERALADRGKHVWVDRAKIEPAADWSERIALGIRNARALIFVITGKEPADGSR